MGAETAISRGACKVLIDVRRGDDPADVRRFTLAATMVSAGENESSVSAAANRASASATPQLTPTRRLMSPHPQSRKRSRRPRAAAAAPVGPSPPPPPARLARASGDNNGERGVSFSPAFMRWPGGCPSSSARPDRIPELESLRQILRPLLSQAIVKRLA
jgi:hypothetical protein